MSSINYEQRSYPCPIRIKIFRYILSDKRLNWGPRLEEKFKMANIRLNLLRPLFKSKISLYSGVSRGGLRGYNPPEILKLKKKK